MNDVGRPLYWSLEVHIEAIIHMIRADELQIALTMCDLLPSWYLDDDNYPPELTEIKKTLYRQMYDQFEYSNDPDERGYTIDAVRQQIASGYMFPRLNIIDQKLGQLNDKGIVPWIFEISPSHGNLAVALTDSGREFNFFGKNMNHLATERFRPWLKDGVWSDQPKDEQLKILTVFEVTEHCHDPQDVVRSAGKMGKEWDLIFLSVPNGCLGGGLENWDTRRLGHVRGWNAKQFLEFADRGFPGYQWIVFKSISLVLVGNKI